MQVLFCVVLMLWNVSNYYFADNTPYNDAFAFNTTILIFLALKRIPRIYFRHLLRCTQQRNLYSQLYLLEARVLCSSDRIHRYLHHFQNRKSSIYLIHKMQLYEFLSLQWKLLLKVVHKGLKLWFKGVGYVLEWRETIFLISTKSIYQTSHII